MSFGVMPVVENVHYCAMCASHHMESHHMESCKLQIGTNRVNNGINNQRYTKVFETQIERQHLEWTLIAHCDWFDWVKDFSQL